MKSEYVSKQHWVDMFREIGLSDDSMHKWHRIFEDKNPEGHQEFLEWLNIPGSEISKIRSL
jgi:hypothetical protein